jgi:hypothetical protein
MLKRIFLSIFISQLTFISCLYAENYTCPSIADVRQLHNIWPHGSWLPLYIDSEELAPEADIDKFSKAANEFTQAQWNANFLEAGHCFYSGSDPIVNKITLARDMLKPKADDELWKLIAPKNFICLGPNAGQCYFGGAG